MDPPFVNTEYFVDAAAIALSGGVWLALEFVFFLKNMPYQYFLENKFYSVVC